MNREIRENGRGLQQLYPNKKQMSRGKNDLGNIQKKSNKRRERIYYGDLWHNPRVKRRPEGFGDSRYKKISHLCESAKHFLQIGTLTATLYRRATSSCSCETVLLPGTGGEATGCGNVKVALWMTLPKKTVYAGG